MALPNFDNIHPKIIEFTFSFPEFAPACKILIQPILESCDQAEGKERKTHYFIGPLCLLPGIQKKGLRITPA